MGAVRFAILMLALLQGCGLKGPLYLPTPEQKRETAERERLLKEREAKRQANAVPQSTPPAETEPAPQQDDSDLLPNVAPPEGGGPPQMEPAAPPPE